MKRLGMVVLLLVVLSVGVCAEVYDSTFPEYCPVSGGAWAEVQTSQGRAVVVVARNYIDNTFGFKGNGYSVANCTSSTVSGYIYFQSPTSYYGRPDTLQCRFSAMSGLSVYEPYENKYGETSYRWTNLPTSAIYATNIALQDETDLGRQNNDYIYTVTDKLLILLVVVFSLGLVFKVLSRGWAA